MQRVSGLVTSVSSSLPVEVTFVGKDRLQKKAMILADCPVALYDWISCYGPTLRGIIQVTDYPEVIITDRWTRLVSIIQKLGYCNQSQAVRVANQIGALNGKPDDGEALANWLDDMAYAYHNAPGEAKDAVTSCLSTLKPDLRAALLRKWYNDRTIRQFRVLGLSSDVIKAIKMKPSKLMAKLRSNPYLVLAIPIEVCDRLAKNFGLMVTPDDRRQALIARTMYTALNKGKHVCLTRKKLYRTYPDLAEHQDGLEQHYGVQVVEGETPDVDLFYLGYPARVEETLLNKIISLRESVVTPALAPPMGIGMTLVSTNDKLEICDSFDQCMQGVDLEDYDPERLDKARFMFEHGIKDRSSLLEFLGSSLSMGQAHACHALLEAGIGCLIGEGGTGKTTCIKSMIEILEARGDAYLLCSFTGKAVARITEKTGREASTIHSLFTRIQHGMELPSSVYVIIDEATMVDGALLMKLLTCLEGVTILGVICCGDPNQLQPMGWGTPFNQMIISQRVPIHRLTKIYRTMDATKATDPSYGTIETNARRLADHKKQPVYTELPNGGYEWVSKPFNFRESADFVVKRGTEETAFEAFNERLDQAVAEYEETLNSDGDAIPISPTYLLRQAIRRVGVVCPYNADVVGMNSLIQDAFGERMKALGEELDLWIEPGSNRRYWHLHDRVMILKNRNCSTNVYNGDLATITALPRDIGKQKLRRGNPSNRIDGYGRLQLDRDGSIVKFAGTHSFRQPADVIPLQDLTTGYAFTVDKSQGSEWDHVIYYVSRATTYFTHSNRAYTAITRGGKTCSIIAHNLTELATCTGTAAPWRSEGLADRIIRSMKFCHLIEDSLGRMYAGDEPESQALVSDCEDGPLNFDYDEDYYEDGPIDFGAYDEYED